MDYFLTECRAIFDAQGSLIFSLFLGGLLGSISHCTGMCGPIVMAQTNTGSSETAPGLTRVMDRALVPYHLGRTLTYMLLGIMGAGMSQYLIGTSIQQVAASVMLMIAGVLFVMKAVPSLVPSSASAPVSAALRPYSRFISTLAAPFSRSSSHGNLFFFGVMLGFLPCGLVMAAVMAVASTGNPLAAAFGMIAFSLGTMPSLMLVGAGTRYMRRHYPEEVDKVANTVMALNGLILCGVALRLAL